MTWRSGSLGAVEYYAQDTINMGLLFRTADTQDVINMLNSAFTSDGLIQLRKGTGGTNPGKSDKKMNKVKDWLDPQKKYKPTFPG